MGIVPGHDELAVKGYPAKNQDSSANPIGKK
jgi:hypothetical protein